jgi:hypothetical protein
LSIKEDKSKGRIGGFVEGFLSNIKSKVDKKYENTLDSPNFEKPLNHAITLFTHRNALAITVVAFCIGTGVALFGFGIIANNVVSGFQIVIGESTFKIKPHQILFPSSLAILIIGIIAIWLGFKRGIVYWYEMRAMEKLIDPESFSKGFRMPPLISRTGVFLILLGIFVYVIFLILLGLVTVLAFIPGENELITTCYKILQQNATVYCGHL